MDKKQADIIIADYMEKIFGFALSKTMNTDKAEELASRIIFDIYTSLLKAGSVHNISGYIYRVASNVYARFVDEEVRGRHISLDEVNVPGASDFTEDLIKDEDYTRLRREISYLGRIQREIIVMHYFQKLKQYEIAERLNIPLGTVKWHLHDARNQLKIKLEKGINRMNKKGTLGMKPIKMSMGHSGNSGPDGKDTSYYLQKLISQNIAYAAYHEPKTITEIAEELGVPAAFVEDEVAYLEDNGFMDKLEKGKYQTNIYITESTKESQEARHELNKKYAKIIREKYIPLVFDSMKDYKSKKIYVPENDFNFLMWSAVGYSIRHLFWLKKGADAHSSKYFIKRKDGGAYIATGRVDNDFEVSYDTGKYRIPNNMTRGGDNNIYSWQISSYFDSRTNDYSDNHTEDYNYMYEYITGKIKKQPEHADKFKRLFDKGYLIEKGDSEYVNMIVAAKCEADFRAMLPAVPEEFNAVGEEFDAEVYKLDKSQYPAHMQDLYRAWCTNCLANQDMIAYVFELLLADGALKPLTEAQKHSVNTILFCDTLPK
jgi:RNA polymerase sigma factor (sigma-70 family)